MTTFGDMKARVSKRLFDTTNTAVSASDVVQAINDAIAYWKNTRFWFNEYIYTGVMTPGNAVLNAPIIALLQGYGLSYYQGNQTRSLTPVSPDYFDMNNYQQSSPPYEYTLRGGVYSVLPKPDQPYTYTVAGLRDYVALVADTDTNDFTVNADQLIMYEAVARGLELREGGDERADGYYQKAQREKDVLSKRTNMMLATGSTRIDTGFIFNNNWRNTNARRYPW